VVLTAILRPFGVSEKKTFSLHQPYRICGKAL
jgi:hypothetical protein